MNNQLCQNKQEEHVDTFVLDVVIFKRFEILEATTVKINR